MRRRAQRRIITAEMAKLVAETGDFAGAEYPIGAKPLVLGRLKTNDIEVHDTKASRKHTRVGRAGGKWVVEDLKSSNGTFVNGTKIEARVELHAGDTIAIGKTVYRFDPEEGPAGAAPRAATATKPPPRAASKPKPAPVQLDAIDAVDAIDGTMEPQELSLEEPEELGLDDDGPAAAPTAPVAPSRPTAPTGPAGPRPAVRGQAIVSINSVQKASRTGILGEDIGQRGALFQGLIYLVGIALFVGIVYGAFSLAIGAMGDPPEVVPAGETPSGAQAGEGGGD